MSQKSNLKDPKETKDAQSIKKEYPLNEEKRESKEENMNVDTNNNIEDAKFTSVNSPIESDKVCRYLYSVYLFAHHVTILVIYNTYYRLLHYVIIPFTTVG